MEVNPGKTETISSKTIYEKDILKTRDDSSKSLTINNSKYMKGPNNNQLKIQEINKEIIFTSNEKLTDHKKISPSKNRYPYCIVWSPIPFLTYIIPCIGHVGIADSKGIIHDFAGSFYVNIGDFTFGRPTKYIQLELCNKEEYEYDKAIEKGDAKFNMERHNLFWNNCHTHVAYVLNQIKYKGKCHYNMFDIWWILIKSGKYISFWSFIKTYLGFFIFILIIVFAIRL
jgi:hypothetical protein